MALSSGTRHLLREAVSWAVIAVAGAVVLTHFEEIKTGMVGALGNIRSADVAAAPQAKANIPRARHSGSVVEIRAARSGHFFTEVEIDGRPIAFMVDTGATMVALSYEDAERAGIYLNPGDFTHSVSTANGRARVAPVMLQSVSIGDITVRDVRAVVSEPGRLRTSLLGMSFLGRLSRFDMRPGLLVLQD
jgi:aspartyl protease family protein